MGKPFKDKLKNVGDFISGTIAEVEKQAKDSEVLEKISKGTKDGLVFVSNGVKDGAEKITNGAKTSADTIKNVVAEHKKQGIQDNNKEKQGSLDDQLHDAVNRYNAAYAEFENKEKKEEIEAVLHNVELVSEVNVKMQSLLDKTDKLRSMLNDQYGNCMTYYGKNFIEIVDEGQMLLGTLVNNAKSLAATLGETVEE